jgi:hypothetical protein
MVKMILINVFYNAQLFVLYMGMIKEECVLIDWIASLFLEKFIMQIKFQELVSKYALNPYGQMIILLHV